MYQASAKFHAAVMSPSAQTEVFVRFEDGTFFTAEDINPIEVTYPLNEDTDLTMGACVASELTATVFNQHGLLSGFAFGKAEFSLGVLTETLDWTKPDGKVSAVYGYGTTGAFTVTAHETTPYLTVNGTAATGQPPFSPDSLVIDGRIVYAGCEAGTLWMGEIQQDGTLVGYISASSWEGLQTVTWAEVASRTWDELSENNVSAFLARKVSRKVGRGITYESGKHYEFTADGVDAYEYVPLGIYYIDTPQKRKTARIEITALDGMKRFDVDCDDWWAGLIWPLTRKALLQSLCAFCGVTLGTQTFIGSGKTISAAPVAGNGLTARDVLGWIAESACAYGRMSRDGKLELVWFTTQDVTLARGKHYGDAPAEYITPSIEALHVMAMDSDLGVMIPAGASGNEYQIIDNPLLYGANEAEIRSNADGIFTRLSAFGAYTPNEVTAIGDWSLEPADVISIVSSDGTTRTLPVFRGVLSWAGGLAKYTLECTGNDGRKPADAATRAEFARYRAYHRLEVDISGIHSEMGDIEGNVASLEVSASQLQVQIAGKIDGEDAQSLIDQTVNKIELSVSSNGSGSTFTLTKDGATLSSETLDLHVKSVNVDGTITADAINLNTAQITGTLSANYIDVDSLTVKNANIESLYANKIVGGNIGGYVAAGAISAQSHMLSSLFVSSFYANNAVNIMNSGDADSGIVIDQAGITQAGTRHYWSDIFSASASAVFG